MQHSTVLCGVDVLAGKHGVDLLPQLSPFCQVCQKLQHGTQQTWKVVTSSCSTSIESDVCKIYVNVSGKG